MAGEPIQSERSTSHNDLDRARLRIFDAVSALKPIDGPTEIKARAQAVGQEIKRIQDDLLLYLHCVQLDELGFDDVLAEIDNELDAGVIPDSSPVEDVVARLRSSLSA